MLYSIRSNLRYQLLILSCSIAVLVYYIVSVGFNFTNIKATVMALAYAWGLILAIYLMGHGLVALPRRVFRSARVSSKLRQLQTQAPRVHDRMTEAIDELDRLEHQVIQLRQRKTGTALDFQDWIAELADTSDMPESRIGPSPSARIAEAPVPAVITERYLADLTRKLKRARHKRIRFIEEWDRLVKDATECQAILDAAPSQRLEFHPSQISQSSTSLTHKPLTLLNPYSRYQLHATVLPALRILLSTTLTLASASILGSELLTPFFPSASLIRLTTIHHPSSIHRGKIGLPGQLIAAAWLCYMNACALASIREVRVWGNRALVRRHTYAESATWYASQVAKLTVPLSYNFITLFPPEVYKSTMFYGFLGRLIDLTSLGSGFSDYFPVFLILPVGLTLFNVYGRIRQILGFGFLDDESEENESGFGTGGWREGRALIDRERLGVGIRGPYATGGASGGGDGAATGAGDTLGLVSRSPSPPTNRLQSSIPRPFTDDTPSSSPTTQSGRNSPMRPYSDNVPPPRSKATGPARGYQTRPPPGRTVSSNNKKLDDPTNPDEDETEGNFFQDFAHRVKNTIDSVDPPFRISRPKWMNADASSSSGGKQGPLDRFFSR